MGEVAVSSAKTLQDASIKARVHLPTESGCGCPDLKLNVGRSFGHHHIA